jgi:hypothetical protein
LTKLRVWLHFLQTSLATLSRTAFGQRPSQISLRFLDCYTFVHFVANLILQKKRPESIVWINFSHH